MSQSRVKLSFERKYIIVFELSFFCPVELRMLCFYHEICTFQSFFGLAFGQNADIDIILDNQDERKMAEIRDENGRKERHYLFFDGESVTGKVRPEIKLKILLSWGSMKILMLHAQR